MGNLIVTTILAPSHQPIKCTIAYLLILSRVEFEASETSHTFCKNFRNSVKPLFISQTKTENFSNTPKFCYKTLQVDGSTICQHPLVRRSPLTPTSARQYFAHPPHTIQNLGLSMIRSKLGVILNKSRFFPFSIP